MLPEFPSGEFSPGKKALQPIAYQRSTARWRKADSKYLPWDQFCLKCNIWSGAWTWGGQAQDQGCIYIKTEGCALGILAWKGKRLEDFERHAMKILIFVLALGIFSCSGKLEPHPPSQGGFGGKSSSLR